MTSKNAYVVVYQIACQHALQNILKNLQLLDTALIRSSAIQ